MSGGISYLSVETLFFCSFAEWMSGSIMFGNHKKTAWFHNPEGHNLNLHHYENFKFFVNYDN